MASNDPTQAGVDNTQALILEARRNGETYLATQLQLAIAADQRAMTLGGILAAASSVLLGFAISGGGTTWSTDLFLGLSGVLALACGLAFYAARPVPIAPPGNQPSGWYEDMEKDVPIADALREDLAVIQRSIETNLKLMAANGRTLKWAMAIAGGAVLVAPVLALTARAVQWQ